MLPLAYSVSKGSHAVASTGVIDNETAFIEDFKHISLDESRAVLCVHMLCYVLDGSIGFSEYVLKEQTTDWTPTNVLTYWWSFAGCPCGRS